MIYSDTTTKTGILQSCEMKLFGDNGYGAITNDSDRIYQFTDRANRAMDRFVFLAMTADGRWQWDDSNNTDLAIATTNVVSGQNQYSFALEHLEIEKVLIKDNNGTWVLIDPMDEDDEDSRTYLENNTGNTGVPTKYDKRGVSLIFNMTPNYNSTNGLKIYFKRGPSYFIYTDTTKAPGIPSIFHPYLVMHMCAGYGFDRQMPVGHATRYGKSFFEFVAEEETAIKQFYSARNKDEKAKLQPYYQDNK